MDRASAIIIPPIMGVIADWCGATATFVILGVALLVCCVPIARIAGRTATPALAE